MDAQSVVTSVDNKKLAKLSIWRARIIAFLWQWLILALAIEVVVIPIAIFFTYNESSSFQRGGLLFLGALIYAIVPGALLPWAWGIVGVLKRVFPDLPRRLMLIPLHLGLNRQKNFPT